MIWKLNYINMNLKALINNGEMGKGVTFNGEEFATLKELMRKM